MVAYVSLHHSQEKSHMFEPSNSTKTALLCLLDSYVVIGAPRSSLPGQPEDAVVSTSILIQVARAFRHVHQLHSWLPRRGVRLVSWGGAELSNIGIVEMIRVRAHHNNLDARLYIFFQILFSRLSSGIKRKYCTNGFLRKL